MKTKKTGAAAQKAEGTSVASLRDLFLDSMRNTYYAEQQLVSTLPDMLENATDAKLKTAIKDHLVQTKEQVERLEKAFNVLGESAEAKQCPAIDGIITAGNSIMENTVSGPVRDAGIIAAAQKVEHYEIAAYGTLAAYAKTLNERTVLDLLLKTLGEEKKSDTLLSYIADTNLNSQAVDDEVQSKDLNAV